MQSLVDKSPEVHVGKPCVFQDLPRSLSWIQDVLYAELALGPTPTKSYLGRVQEPNCYLEGCLCVCEVVDISFRFAF